MYFLYLDESIDKKNKLVTVGSVILPSSKHRKFNESFNSFLLNKFKIDEEVEIKGDYIWNGREYFKGKEMNERANIALEIAKFLARTTLTKFVVGHKYFDGGDENQAYLDLIDDTIGFSAKLVSDKPKTSRQLLLVFDERQDINEKIYELCAKKRKQIISKYKSACTFIDNGYEGISKYSRLLQVADFVGYFIRNEKVTPKESTLFETKADSRKIELMKQIKNCLSKKLRVL